MSKTILAALLSLVEGRCPSCDANELHSATLNESAAISCGSCGWIENPAAWRQQIERLNPSKRTGTDAVIQIRDEFLQLVSAYNTVGEYKNAQDAQAMAIALNLFENAHIITEIAWPPRTEIPEGSKWPQLVVIAE